MRELIIREFTKLIPCEWAAQNAQVTTLDKLIHFSQEHHYNISTSFKKAFLEAVNQKLSLNAKTYQNILDAAFQDGFKLNYHLKNQIMQCLDLSDESEYFSILTINSIDSEEMRRIFTPVSEETTLAELTAVLSSDLKYMDIVSSIFSRYCFNLFEKECTSKFFSGEDYYTQDYFDYLAHLYPDMCKRDNALSILDITDTLFRETYEKGINQVFKAIHAVYEELNNHCDAAVVIPPIAIDGKDLQWTIFKDVVLFSEKHISHPIEKTYFRWQKIKGITTTYISGIDESIAAFDIANEGFVFKDCFILAGPEFHGSYSLLLIFEKNVRDERIVHCPACRTVDIQGNSYPILNVRSWECENPLCPDRSKYNRGKRYTFSSVMRQKLMQDSRNIIPEESISRWHLDCVEDCSKIEGINMCIRHYSCAGDGVKIYSDTLNLFDVSSLSRSVSIVPFPSTTDDLFSEFFSNSFFKRFIVENKTPAVQSSDYAIIGKAKIFHGDCHHVLRFLAPNSLDAAVTSPPYYNAKEYSQWPNIYCYLYDMYNISLDIFRVLKPGAVYLFNIFDYFDNEKNIVLSAMGDKRMILGAYMLDIFQRIGFNIVGNIIWYKGEIHGNRSFNQGNMTPYYQAPLNCWEHIFILSKGQPDEKFSGLQSSIASIRPVIKMVKGKNTLGHTAPFPVEIPDLLIDCLTDADIVLDPFLGSGTTCISANRHNVNSIGIEMNGDYYLLSQKIIEEKTMLLFN
ncbi:site-specific DNA-methyltransferase [uncultured Pediococcus sp.]|uniref:DNA-methyltransferase n=1 Tax=uncultured Pediococcus sp. TaxID=165192 RepID=UPI00259B3C1B|nr:site-specific DNA-methyltransferase [uncultured Pediococcus sp.]